MEGPVIFNEMYLFLLKILSIEYSCLDEQFSHYGNDTIIFRRII